MPGIKINFADVQGSFEPLPEGAYECVVEVVEVRESQSSDNDYLNWELKVLSDMSGDTEHENRKLWMITSLGEKALWKLKDTLVTLEVINEDDELDIEWEEGVDITPKEGPRVITPELEGLPCVAIVRNEVYEGRERNRVNELVASGTPVSKTGVKGTGAKQPQGRQRRKLR